MGYAEGGTQDYIRHGTATLLAALDVASGAVIAEWKPRRRHQEFLSFLRQIDREVPLELNVHLIVDNDCTHQHAVDRRSSAQC
jgi:putative transposase